ncbi:MAG: hypothetical protein K0Q62_481 [Phenylobacterium sp.]|nr:hypothetical protein [Phenylobacterium sp.]
MTAARRHMHFHIASLMTAALAVVVTAIPTDAFSRPTGGGRAAASSVHRGGGAGAGAHQASGARAHSGARPAATRPANGARVNQGGNVNRGGNTVARGGNRVNTGNVNIGNDVNIDVDNGWDNNGWDYHPVARGVAFGTAAAVTSAVVGSMIYSLPPSCATRPYGGVSYSYCDGVWYQPQYSGSSVTYIVVNQPY